MNHGARRVEPGDGDLLGVRGPAEACAVDDERPGHRVLESRSQPVRRGPVGARRARGRRQPSASAAAPSVESGRRRTTPAVLRRGGAGVAAVTAPSSTPGVRSRSQGRRVTAGRRDGDRTRDRRAQRTWSGAAGAAGRDLEGQRRRWRTTTVAPSSPSAQALGVSSRRQPEPVSTRDRSAVARGTGPGSSAGRQQRVAADVTTGQLGVEGAAPSRSSRSGCRCRGRGCRRCAAAGRAVAGRLAPWRPSRRRRARTARAAPAGRRLHDESARPVGGAVSPRSGAPGR